MTKNGESKPESTTIKKEMAKNFYSLHERILLMSLIPQQGSMIDIIIAKDLTEKLKLNQDLVKEFEIKDKKYPNNTYGTVWNDKGNETKFLFNFSNPEKEFIKRQLEKMNKDESLSIHHIRIYNIFCK